VLKLERGFKMDNINFHDLFPLDQNKETITEEMHPEKAWFAEAGKMTEKELPNFFARIIHGYNHDYGTACHAVAACALAAAWAACGDSDIGLSGFQAGFVMWDFIRNWTKTGNKCGLRLVDYDDMLYPQYKEKFDKVIDREIWESIQTEAREKLNSDDGSEYVREHWKKIANGEVPFGYRVVERL